MSIILKASNKCFSCFQVFVTIFRDGPKMSWFIHGLHIAACSPDRGRASLSCSPIWPDWYRLVHYVTSHFSPSVMLIDLIPMVAISWRTPFPIWTNCTPFLFHCPWNCTLCISWQIIPYLTSDPEIEMSCSINKNQKYTWCSAMISSDPKSIGCVMQRWTSMACTFVGLLRIFHVLFLP